MPQKYCSNCGKAMAGSANYCPSCGSMQGKQISRTQDTGTSHQQQSTKQTDNALPYSENIEKRRLCGRAIWSFFLSYLAKTGMLLLLFIIGGIFEPLLFIPIIVAYILILYVAAVLVHLSYYYEITEHAFRKEYGIIHKNDVTIPFTQIQNVNITRSLSDRILGLARVDVESAGSSSITNRSVGGGSQTKAEGHLPGVTVRQAKIIHDTLLERFSNIQDEN